MADRTAIEWCDATFNPWIGCTRVSPACDHCYAAVSTPARALDIEWGAGQPRRRTSAANWKLPLRWSAKRFYECHDCGHRGEGFHDYRHQCSLCRSSSTREARRRVFCASLADVFDNEVDQIWRRDLFELILATPNLDWLLLTKRIGNAHDMIREALSAINPMMQVEYPWPWQNVWLGATIANQQEADRDIPKLLRLPAHVRFLSMEPLLQAVELRHHLFGHCPEHDFPSGFCLQRHHAGVQHLHWVIAGGESGTAARPMSPDWVRALRDQCAAAGVPFLFKQWGEWIPMLGQVEGVPVRDKTTTPDGWVVGRAGKKRAGRTLDGATHTDFPEVRHG